MRERCVQAQVAAAKAGAALARRGITFQSKGGQVTSPVSVHPGWFSLLRLACSRCFVSCFMVYVVR
jgi:hypothetical protein